jgi:hypothetical protein
LRRAIEKLHSKLSLKPFYLVTHRPLRYAQLLRGTRETLVASGNFKTLSALIDGKRRIITRLRQAELFSGEIIDRCFANKGHRGQIVHLNPGSVTV